MRGGRQLGLRLPFLSLRSVRSEGFVRRDTDEKGPELASDPFGQYYWDGKECC